MASTVPAVVRRHAGKLLVSLAIGAIVAVVLLRGGLPLLPPRESLSLVGPWAVATFVALHAVWHWIKAVRWRHLVRPIAPVPVRVLVSVSWVSFAVILFAPLRAGEIVRPILLSRRSSVRAWEATGTVGAERVVDGLTLSALLAAAIELAPRIPSLPDRVAGLPVPVTAVRGAAWTTLGVFVAAFAVMSLFFWRRAFARRLTRAVVGVVSTRLADGLSEIVERLASGLQFLPKASAFGPFMLETGAFWALNILGVWVLGVGAGLPDFSLARAAVTLGCTGIGVLIPSGPGFFGVFQLSCYAALALYYPEDVIVGRGAVFVFLLYVIQVAFYVFAAAVGLALDPRTKAAEAESIAREGHVSDALADRADGEPPGGAG